MLSLGNLEEVPARNPIIPQKINFKCSNTLVKNTGNEDYLRKKKFL